MKPSEINILIACEESQVECEAFRKRGFNAFSCDLQQCRMNGHPEWHIIADVTPFLNGRTQFVCQDAKRRKVKRWHVIIAHPPCTYLCKVSSVHMVINGELNLERYRLMQSAREFFMKCLEAKADYVAVENPLPMARAELPKPTSYVDPSWYGHKYTKKTLYWLRNLPPLLPTVTNPDAKSFVYSSRGKYRSRTFEGVAEAMADQWGAFILDDLKKG